MYIAKNKYKPKLGLLPLYISFIIAGGIPENGVRLRKMSDCQYWVQLHHTSELMYVLLESYCFQVAWKCQIVGIPLPYHLKRDLIRWEKDNLR